MTASRKALVRWTTTATSDPRANRPSIPWTTKSAMEASATLNRVELVPKSLRASTVVTTSTMKVRVPQADDT